MIVIDTNVISEAMAVAPNATVSRWLSSQHGPMLFTTTISIAEILYGFPSIAVERRLRGRPITLFDAQIAAIARVHGAALATRNSAAFEGCGIRLVNPWVD